MLPIHPASQAATHCQATPPAPPTATRSGTKSAPVPECGVNWISVAIFRVPPATAALTQPPSLPRRAARLPPLVPSWQKTKSLGRMSHQTTRRPLTLHLQLQTLLSSLKAPRSQGRAPYPCHLVPIAAPIAQVMAPPTPGVLLFCYNLAT